MVDTITMPGGAQVKTLENLREHFDLISVLEYYTSGMLLKWLKSLHYEKEADAVAAMNPFMPEFEKTLCSLFQVPFSLEQMMASYEKAARENCAEAQFRLGCCYLFGYGVVINRGTKGITKNHKKIVKGADLTKQAAEQGHPFAQYSLGNYCRHVQGFDEAAAWYQKAADQGYIEALYSLGTVENCLKAAERGHVRAQVQLGKSFFHGSGVEQDYQEVAKWYRKAAEHGDMEAEYRLSLCYLTGKGVKKDEEEAEKWCSRAGEKDTVPGEFRLGEQYFYYGCDIQQDFHEAAKWYHRAFVKEDIWPVMNKLDLCLAVMLGEELVYKDTYPPMYFRGVAAQKYLDSYIPNEEYNDNVNWLLSGGVEGGIRQWPFYSRFAMYEIPSAGPDEDVEVLWCWRLAHRTGK